LIRSVQRGTISIGPAASSNTATIVSVDPVNAVVRWLGQSYGTDGVVDERPGWTYVTLTNATTVTATRGATSNTSTASYEVVEFAPGVIRSIQRGTIALNAATSATGAVTEVNSSKSELTYTGETSGDGFGYPARYLIRVVLTNSTTVTATRGNATNNMVSSYQLVEFF
jgi:hypothetical protein